MDVFEAKKKVLELLIDKFQCYKCKDVPSPEKNQRFDCTGENHPLCFNCKFPSMKCPCGSHVSKRASRVVETFFQDTPVPWMCSNYKRGCREIMSFDDLATHQRKCLFRQIFCPVFACKSEKIGFGYLLNHVNSEHSLKSGKKSKDGIGYEFEYCLKLTKYYNGPFQQTQFLEWNSSTFFVNLATNSSDLIFWVSLYGSPEGAKNYSCTIEMNQDSLKFIYSGPVHTLDEENNKIMVEQPLVSIKKQIVDKLLDSNSVLRLRLTINRLPVPSYRKINMK